MTIIAHFKTQSILVEVLDTWQQGDTTLAAVKPVKGSPLLTVQSKP